VNASNLLKTKWYIIFPAIAAVAFGIRKYKKTEPGRQMWDRIKLKIPMKIGQVVLKVTMARFSRTLSTLVAAGVDIIKALEITGQTAGNWVVEEALADVRNFGENHDEEWARDPATRTEEQRDTARILKAGADEAPLHHLGELDLAHQLRQLHLRAHDGPPRPAIFPLLARVGAFRRFVQLLFELLHDRALLADRFDLLEVIDVVPGIVHRDIANGFGAAFGVQLETWW